MVTILVGKDKTPFILHQTPLIRKSPVFWADLASETEDDNEEPGGCLESRHGTSRFTHIGSTALSSTIALLGHHITTVQRSQVGRDAEKAKLDNGELVDDLMRLWTRTAVLMDVSFQNIVSDELVRWLLDRRSLTFMSTKTFDCGGLVKI